MQLAVDEARMTGFPYMMPVRTPMSKGQAHGMKLLRGNLFVNQIEDTCNSAHNGSIFLLFWGNFIKRGKFPVPFQIRKPANQDYVIQAQPGMGLEILVGIISHADMEPDFMALAGKEDLPGHGLGQAG